jgi:hypothetical protein
MKPGWNIFLFFLLINLITGGGRLPSSDETSIYLMTESIATHGTFDIPPGIIDNGSFWNGKFYSWYEVGQSLFSLPWYYAGYAAIHILPIPSQYHALVLKAVISTFNAFVGAAIASLFFIFAKKLGYSNRLSFFLTVNLCVATNLFPYLKSFMREPLLLLFLLASVYWIYSYKLDPSRKSFLLYAGLFSGFGFLTKFTFALNVIILVGYFLFVVWKQHLTSLKPIVRESLYFFMPMLVGVAGILLYNYLRFSDWFDLGYHGGTAFSTPLYVGLFGQLFSSGKSIFLYAPITVLFLWGFASFYRQWKSEALLFLLLIAGNLILYSMYVSWAGEGSWGSRYLIPILPFLILPVGIFLHNATRLVKSAAIMVTIFGLIVQIAGISIYFGNYYRQLGEFPYQRNFDDSEFMYKSHFIPNYSPVLGHWRMLVRNLDEHLRGEMPLISVSNSDQQKRIPIAVAEQEKLFHTFDYWFTYPYYTGITSPLPILTLALLFGLLVFQTVRMRKFVFGIRTAT